MLIYDNYLYVYSLQSSHLSVADANKRFLILVGCSWIWPNKQKVLLKNNNILFHHSEHNAIHYRKLQYSVSIIIANSSITYDRQFTLVNWWKGYTITQHSMLLTFKKGWGKSYITHTNNYFNSYFGLTKRSNFKVKKIFWLLFLSSIFSTIKHLIEFILEDLFIFTWSTTPYIPRL